MPDPTFTDTPPKPPSPLERARYDLESAAETILRGSSDFKRRKARIVRELEKTAQRVARGKPRKSPEQKAAEQQFKSDPVFNPNKPQRIHKSRTTSTRRRMATFDSEEF